MKAICGQDTFNGKKLRLEVGVVYNVSQCPVYPDNYDVAELPDYMGHPISYRKILFIPLSIIDETELIRERKTELA